MRNNSIILLLRKKWSNLFCLGILFIALPSLQAQNGKSVNPDFELTDIKPVTTSGELSMPIWSPDGTKLLAASTHEMKLHLIDLKTKNETKISDVRGSGFDASWSADGQTIYYRHKDDPSQMHPEVKSISVENKKINESKLNPNGLISASKAVDAKDPIVFINVETLGIEAHTKDGTECWNITSDNGQYYRPLLSPDKTKLIVHKGSEMLLFAVDGSGLIKRLGTGIASSWSPDGNYVISFLDHSHDGHTISGSELYMIDIEKGSLELLTNTADVNEMWPNWSPDGKQIAFEDERTGKIHVANISKK